MIKIALLLMSQKYMLSGVCYFFIEKLGRVKYGKR